MRDLGKHTKAAEIVQKCLKDVAKVPNSNIITNANDLLTTLQHNHNDITWIGTTKQRVDIGRTCWLPATCLIVIYSYFSLAEL